MLSKLKFQWWKLSTQVYNFFYRLTHRRQIKADQELISRINKTLSANLAQELAGEKPVKIKITNAAGWQIWPDQKLKLDKDFVDLRLKDEQKITIRKENK